MGSWKAAFGSTYKTEDLEGKPIRAVVESVGYEDIGQDEKKERKLVMRLVGKDKGLVLNKTKCVAMTEIAGTDDVDQWPGIQVVMEPGTTMFGGKSVGCINLRAPRVGAAAPVPRPTPQVELPSVLDDSDIPFVWLLPLLASSLSLLA